MRTRRDPFDRLVDLCEWQDNCLVYQGTGPREYGQFRPGSRESDPKVYVHRWLYETTIGPIPEGMEIDHVASRGCISKRCINPDHLEVVEHRENQRRMRLATCRSGKHDLSDDENCVWDADGNRRGCKPCREERALARRQ